MRERAWQRADRVKADRGQVGGHRGLPARMKTSMLGRVACDGVRGSVHVSSRLMQRK